MPRGGATVDLQSRAGDEARVFPGEARRQGQAVVRRSSSDDEAP